MDATPMHVSATMQAVMIHSCQRGPGPCGMMIQD
jgi:hypothetical protein